MFCVVLLSGHASGCWNVRTLGLWRAIGTIGHRKIRGSWYYCAWFVIVMWYMLVMLSLYICRVGLRFKKNLRDFGKRRGFKRTAAIKITVPREKRNNSRSNSSSKKKKRFPFQIPKEQGIIPWNAFPFLEWTQLCPYYTVDDFLDIGYSWTTNSWCSLTYNINHSKYFCSLIKIG